MQISSQSSTTSYSPTREAVSTQRRTTRHYRIYRFDMLDGKKTKQKKAMSSRQQQLLPWTSLLLKPWMFLVRNSNQRLTACMQCKQSPAPWMFSKDSVSCCSSRLPSPSPTVALEVSWTVLEVSWTVVKPEQEPWQPARPPSRSCATIHGLKAYEEYPLLAVCCSQH